MTTIYTTKQLPTRDPFDFYPTPLNVAETMVRTLPTITRWDVKNVLDPGAGEGVFGKAIQKHFGATVTGVDIRDLPKPSSYTFWMREDFQLLKPEPTYDLVIGNPPYKYAEAFVRQSMKFLVDGGWLCFLLRLNFLAGQARGKGLWRQFPAYEVTVSSGRISYTGDGKSNATEYAFFTWRKGWKGQTALKWTAHEDSALEWVDDERRAA